MNILYQLLRYVSVGFVIAACYPIAALACNPALATVCQRFERAEAVFVGTLTNTKEKDEKNLIALYATFEVKETFKGVVGKVETVKFRTSDCDPKIDRVGAVYFVNKDPYTRVPLVANYTHLLSNPDEDLAFAKRVNPKHSIFHVGGVLIGLSKSDLLKVHVYLSDGERKKAVQLDGDGWFEYVGKRKGTYTVTVNLPTNVTIFWEQLNVSSGMTEGKSIAYTIDFRPNGCDVRQLNISPI